MSDYNRDGLGVGNIELLRKISENKTFISDFWTESQKQINTFRNGQVMHPFRVTFPEGDIKARMKLEGEKWDGITKLINQEGIVA